MSLRILHLSQYRTQGGAAKMAWALHSALLAQGAESLFLCQEPLHRDPGTREPDLWRYQGEVPGERATRRPRDHGTDEPGPNAGLLDGGIGPLRAIRRRLDRAPLALYPRRTREPYSPGLVPGGLLPEIRRLSPDVLHLHWLGGGFVSIAELSRLPGPLVWTLHDLWPFTGGCHYPGSCVRYQGRCGSCPVLGSSVPLDLSTLAQQWKEAYARRADLYPVGTSQWMSRKAQESHLFQGRTITWIPNGVDREVFAPGDRATARKAIGLPAHAPLVLFGAVNPFQEARKGAGLLMQALRRISRDPELSTLSCVVVGAGSHNPDLWRVPVFQLGSINDPSRMALAFRAADVVVVPSLEEAYGLVTAEALCCQTPVVAFRGTGADDLIHHRLTGYLAAPKDAEALAEGILWALRTPRHAEDAATGVARQPSGPLDIREVALRYMGLYADILAQL